MPGIAVNTSALCYVPIGRARSRASRSSAGPGRCSLSPRFSSKATAGLQPSKRLASCRTEPRRAVCTCAVGRGNKLPDVVIPEPDFKLGCAVVFLGGLAAIADNAFVALPVGALGAFLLFQSARVKFVFSQDSLEVMLGGIDEVDVENFEKTGENPVAGGDNKWRFDTFTNWEMWWPGFPVLVYFKETQTKPEGQIHFFPIIMNGEQLYEVMVERCGNSQNSLPKD